MIDYKNADKATLKAEYKRLSRETHNLPFFTRKEFYALPEILGDEETPVAITSGMMNDHTWLIVLTNRRILFLDKGMLFGGKQVIISLADITAIQGSTGLIYGEITISTAGQKHEISHIYKKAVNSFIQMTDKERDQYRSDPIQKIKPFHQNTSDKVTQLEKLAALKNQGILTEEEFEKEKRRILAL
ncbi:bacterial PH domain-containing protein [Zymomonas mobilis subsp. mobilis ZM4 = ATCC 31821]|uniref:Phage protein n=1 Tax=Zymomonas mobilis subsp. mobilis (strain ATCC 31821 / ZM4 / CP4) TaxID=264203 RepID=Q5NRH3_ZYMMO|nr:PH domain-containing protein [Zymomonas mobilis]AAV88681.1 phage protein [Zymomonas mobilis subsp. mobilis ZM4 = ATCC 31821]ACV75676.1 phage protein [Zymomonas mobilis subsp. mobilis NCIMB 11163]AFN57030.1 phage protein [Zymomonas mobilis subsp. mobilis ATCC 29191]AHB10463.1 putative membrane protein (DUF2078) [Zymomonas mobilis subsp. mobilis str. CP4 = NRRL B-14023]AHJ70769.1 hypothetical protein A254_01158 [Zymomonas mobilis subsp. mobilis NRRL B-12526]